MTNPSEQIEPGDTLPRSATLLFAPLDKRAFGVAIGVALGVLIFAVTAVDLLIHSPWLGLGLLGEYLVGYTVSWPGAFVGLLWGFALGFCAGWFVAFVRNVVMAVSLFILQTRAELDDTRDFLDHI
ncbi:MAG: hypothetical protein ABR582_05210 [Gemmatimonadaceae bacterium]